MRKFSMGECVLHDDGARRRRGTIVDCNLDVPPGSEDKRTEDFYRVKFEKGGSEILAASEIDPCDSQDTTR